MSAAVLWSGGKDSTLALHRAVDDGISVTTLFNLCDAVSGRVRFHGVRRELIAAQADALGLALLQLATTPDDFEVVFLDGLRQLQQRGIDTIVLGNIHLADVRAWYEDRTTAMGFAHVEPLWGEAPRQVVTDVVRLGYRACITGIDCERAQHAWLGRDLDDALTAEFVAAGIDPAGESGEYHSFVHDGPRFRAPVPFSRGEIHDAGSHAFIELLAAGRFR